MNRVLVTGATGFVGRHLVMELTQRGCSLVAACRRPLTQPWARNVQCVDFDLNEPSRITESAFLGVDCIYHLAARVHVIRRSIEDAQQFSSLNVKATENLAIRAAQAGVRRFVFLSSIKVNGERTHERPFNAQTTPAPEDEYGLSKWEAEQALTKVWQSTGIEVVIVRPPLVYGAGVGANFRRLMSLAYLGWPLPLASVSNQRSLISVWNLVDWLWRAGSHPALPGRTWLDSDGQDVSTPTLLELLSSSMNRRARLWRFPVSLLRGVGSLTGRSAELNRLLDSLQVDIVKTCMAMNWKPRMSLEEGIARTAAWYLEHRRSHG